MPWNKRTTRKDRKRNRRQRAREAINGHRAYVAILDRTCREAFVRGPRPWVFQWEDALDTYREFLSRHIDLAEPFITGGESDALEP